MKKNDFVVGRKYQINFQNAKGEYFFKTMTFAGNANPKEFLIFENEHKIKTYIDSTKIISVSLVGGWKEAETEKKKPKKRKKKENPKWIDYYCKLCGESVPKGSDECDNCGHDKIGVMDINNL
jgi:hypothetical protein